MNIELNEVESNKIYHIKTRNNGILVEQLLNLMIKTKKKKFKSKFKGDPITAKEIHVSFPDQKIYLNDQLSTGNRKILCLIKPLATNYNFKYVWKNSSGVYS